jgi:hypothetical protein
MPRVHRSVPGFPPLFLTPAIVIFTKRAGIWLAEVGKRGNSGWELGFPGVYTTTKIKIL